MKIFQKKLLQSKYETYKIEIILSAIRGPVVEEIIIEKINYKAFVIVLATIFLLIAAFAITVYGFDEKKMRYWLPGIIALVGLFIGLIVALVDAKQVKRLITITREGVIDNSSISGVGYVSFDDIKEFIIIKIYNRKAIAIIPKNVDSLLSNLSMVKRSMAKRNINANLPPVLIATHLAKDMDPEDILSLLMKRLTDYSSLYE